MSRSPYAPRPGESLAIADRADWKRTALLFDRIYSGNDGPDSPPSAVAFRHEAADRDLTVDVFIPQDASAEEGAYLAHCQIMRRLVSVYGRHGVVVTPVYRSAGAFEVSFSPGPDSAYQVVLDRLPMVDEAATPWQQVLDFREDQLALKAYRGVHRWIRSLPADYDQQRLNDELDERLDRYEWAVTKHGLTTKLGALSAVLATAAGKGLLAGIPPAGATAVGTAGLVLWVMRQKLELEDLQHGHREVALIYEAQRAFSDRAV